jgi:anti-sigma regulatory factor (Ser/Thr protein kinase)
VLDPEASRATIVSAGHPPPLVIDAEGAARYLAIEPDVALGVSSGSDYREQVCDLPPGSTIVLYTDGVVEVRGEPLDEGLERLRALAARGHETVEALCDAAIRELVADARPVDDVALLAAHVAELSDRLVTHWPARAEALAGLRHLLRRWLRHQGADDDETYDITVACQEASANAVEHAYAPGDEAFEVEAARRGSSIEVTIRDRGRWREPRGTHRGRGLPMMRALMDSVEVEQTAEGTTVTLRRTLRQEAA